MFYGVLVGLLLFAAGREWPSYGGDPGGSRYSTLQQINRTNVGTLKVAWTYHTGDISDGTKYPRKSAFECTPIFVNGTLYLTTPFNRVVALDPASGKERWAFDPKIKLDGKYSEGLMNRGVSAWRRRIFVATIDARLICLDAASGKPCQDFGDGGQIDLKRGIANIIREGEYEETSPPAIVDDLVIVGSSIADNDRVDSPNGVVRAFDARTGKLRWKWDPIPASLAANLGATGGGNAWSMISVDAARDLVFVPTGSPSPDYHGAKRPGDNKWANSVVALRGKDGKFVWGFQLVHHDLWDYDTAPQPVLATVGGVPAVIQGNKTGNLFVLNRETGAPIFRVEERPVPASDAEQEHASPTQPFPVAPPPLVRQELVPDDACRERIARFRNEGIFTPPSVRGTVAMPGNLGGMNWSSGGFDPERQTFVTNVNHLAMEVHLIPRDQYLPKEQAAEAGKFRGDVSPQHGTPYGMSRELLRSPKGLPCAAPPWGELVAVDLAKGTIRWRVPLGESLTVDGMAVAVAGTPNLGGPITTAGGLIFISSAMDNYLRAFDIETGKELWKAHLPAGSQAMPMTYEVNGKQYVVVAAGGHGKLGTTLGDSLVAFALP